MTMFAMPAGPDGGINDELLALAKLEATSNAIRLRIAALAPDQLYRGSGDQLTITELIANSKDREEAYLNGFRRALVEREAQLEEPRPGLSFMDRDFADDIALFFDLRRMTLDTLRMFSEAEWQRTLKLPDGKLITLEELALRLQRHDAHMLQAISKQRHVLLKLSGIDELRDRGMAGKLGQNLGQ